MRTFALLIALISATLLPAHAQFALQDSHTTADLWGIDYVGNGVAWASGTNGTVLRTVDEGKTWTTCAVPPDAEHLDFRGVQAFDSDTVIVMSSGKGDLSRLYRTTDGCKTWMLVFTNPDVDGFWDSLRMWTPTDGFLAGDPVDGILYLAESTGYWNAFLDQGEDEYWKARPGEAAFAASNSSLSLAPFRNKDGEAREVWLATGGTSGARIFHYKHFNGGEPERQSAAVSDLAYFPKSASAGIFSVCVCNGTAGVAVGGDYDDTNASRRTAAYTSDGDHWSAPNSYPHGYRSAVAYDADLKTWITVGPNGTDVSTDDGRNWRAVHPDAALNESPDADREWNALSLPFVVGPHGRIGKLDADALRQSK